MAFKIKAHDTRPRYVVGLKEAYNTPSQAAIDLNLATQVRFLMRPTGESDDVDPVVDGVMSITDAPNGIVTYEWQTGDTDLAGTYDAEFEITWSDGGVETVPNGPDTEGKNAYLQVLITDDLDAN